MSHEKPDDLCDKLARAIFEFFETRQIRAPESKRQTYEELPARYRRDYLRYANDAILPIVARTVAEGREALTEVERQARHIGELQNKIDAEKSCACSYDAPGDVCVAHSPALAAARAEIERLRVALEFYADENRYKTATVHMCGHATGQAVMLDRGKRARKALEGEP